VVNLLDVNVPKSDPQILLKVRFASVDRSKARQLGVNLFDLGLGNALGGVTTGVSPPAFRAAPQSSRWEEVTGTAGFGSSAKWLNIFAFFPGPERGGRHSCAGDQGRG
jgi:pilus assembly protein CpaC